jgi:2-polyprenyl-6-methoxyphenol hydroxylase-like FAD-dependent oxidoreductase
MRALDVGVIGCGTAGSAAAIFLARAGHRVTIYERVGGAVPLGPVGAGITVQPTGLHVLERLGLYPHVSSRGAPIDRLVCERRTKGPGPRPRIVELAYETVEPGLFGLGVHRGVLFEALLAAVRREPLATLRTGVELVDLAPAERRERGSPRSWWLIDADRERHGPHELVVVADGARSQLRDNGHHTHNPHSTGTRKRVTPYPWGALWFVGRDDRDSSTPVVRTLHQVVDGNQRFLGLLPTGLTPLSDESPLRPSRRLVSLFWSIRGDRVEAWKRGGLEAWKAEVLALAPEAEPVVQQIDDEGQVLYASYHDVVMHRWHTRNVVYLGDAAHATSPQLGQGTNLALWDAMVLADCIDEEARDLSAALDRYSRRRRDHLAVYQTLTRCLTPFFQGDAELLASLRDVAMPLLGRIPLFRRLMTLCMIGVIDGFSGRTLTLRLPARL